jgi:hypothetical protein
MGLYFWSIIRLGGMAQEYPTPPAYREFRQAEDGYLALTAKGVSE